MRKRAAGARAGGPAGRGVWRRRCGGAGAGPREHGQLRCVRHARSRYLSLSSA
jgi:hypothetical protein